MENKETDYETLYRDSLLTLSEKESILSEKDDIIADLGFELDKLRRYIFGFKSEKRNGSAGDNQMGLFELGVTQSVQEELSCAVQQPKPAPKKRAKGTGRMSLPEELTRKEIVIEPSESTEGCTKIGEEVTEVLEIEPAFFYVKRYVRPKYAKPNGEGILIGILPDRVIEKGIPSESVIAQLMVDKYVYGMPLHRQIDKYSKMGVRIPASSASDWLMSGWEELKPLWELLRLIVFSQKYLQADESPIKVLDRDHKNGIHKGYMWLYHAPVDRLVLFDYRKGRDSSGPLEMLSGFKGILQTDGYVVYESLYGNHPDILLTFCMAHSRRYFVNALKDDATQANYVLDEMQLLYALEQRMREEKLDWEKRSEERKTHALPVLDRLEKWMKENQYKYRPNSPMGKAIDYTLSRWTGLTAYVHHGQMEIDNNLIENAVRPLAIGRKNFLFAGSHEAAQMAAGVYSFMASCKKNDINEFEWLKDVLERIQSHKQKDLYQLLPSNWQQYRNNPIP
jgi:transposase